MKNLKDFIGMQLPIIHNQNKMENIFFVDPRCYHNLHQLDKWSDRTSYNSTIMTPIYNLS